MNTKQMADYVAEQCNHSKKKTRKIIDAFFCSVFESLLKGEEVNFRNFGRFYLKIAQEKRTYDPHNKLFFTLPQHTKIKFSASKKMQTIIKNIEVK